MKAILILAICAFVLTEASAKMPYPASKTWYEQAQTIAPTKSQQIQNLREVVLRGEKGTPG